MMKLLEILFSCFLDEISAHYTWRNYFLTRQLTSSDCGQSPYIFAFEVKNEEEFNSRILHAQIPIIVQFFAELSLHKYFIFIVIDALLPYPYVLPGNLAKCCTLQMLFLLQYFDSELRII